MTISKVCAARSRKLKGADITTRWDQIDAYHKFLILQKENANHLKDQLLHAPEFRQSEGKMTHKERICADLTCIKDTHHLGGYSQATGTILPSANDSDSFNPPCVLMATSDSHSHLPMSISFEQMEKIQICIFLEG
jgi:hypothetical protein